VERALVAEYRDVITRLADGLSLDNHARAVEIAGLPDMVRGYEEIKLRNVRAYRERMAELLTEFTAVVPSVTG
jgi:indolepyruvate ferredoxin oxidoreductase